MNPLIAVLSVKFLNFSSAPSVHSKKILSLTISTLILRQYDGLRFELISICSKHEECPLPVIGCTLHF